MVSKKKQDYGFSGYRAPIIPRAPRSIRTRGPRKILEEDSKLCAFELLAAVAGKLLKESESSASSNIAEGNVQLRILEDANDRGQPKDDKALKTESYDHGSCAESAFIPDISVQEKNLLFNFKGLPEADNESVLEHNSLHASSEFLKKVDCDIKLGISEEKSTIGSSICLGNSFKTELPENQSEDDKNKIGDLSMANTYNVKDLAAECENTNVLINSDSSVQLPLYRNPIPGSSPRKHCNNVKLGIRDDDENSFGCSKFSTKIRSFKPQSRIGHRRIRKMVASKYWKAGPKLKDCELYNTSEGMKTFYRYRKHFYARERYQRAAPMKKRKLSDHSFAVEYDQEASSDCIFNLPEKEPRTVKGHQKTKDSHVQFSIKSFKVPELYVEVPETATVSSLKRTVMEAVTAILGGGLRVGVVLQGKKIRDDSRTLQQAGISQSSNLDTLGFTLEPSFTHLSPTKTPKKQKLPLVLASDVDQQSPRSPATPMIHSGISNASIGYPSTTNFGDVNNGEIVSSPKTPVDAPMNGAVVTDSKALVPVSPMDTEALEVVPINSKSKRSELSQRRTRRPFSVGEVEALVEAVETLGTGRWRDVKMRAFETADHRTYVDLKDKWKTLVHTASISPQQRRGEPVPQELLDRVLSAHSYWSLHQSKQHGKVPPIDGLKIVDAREEIVG